MSTEVQTQPADYMWLITIEMKELRARGTTRWLTTLISTREPDEVLADHHGKTYFAGRDDESYSTAVLVMAVQVEATPARLALLDEYKGQDAEIGQVHY